MPDTKLTAEDATRFAEDGFFFKRGFFDDEEIGLIRRALEVDETLMANVVEVPDDEWGVTEAIVWNQPGDDFFGAISRCARMVDGMEALFGGEVYHYHAKLILKPPGKGGGFRWHQDFGYWYEAGILFPDLASVIIAVDPMRRDNGCLQFLRGSHRLGRLTHVQVRGHMCADPDHLAEAQKVLDTVYVKMEPGDVMFQHCNTLHASDPNTSESPRTALVVCYNMVHNNPFRAHHHCSYTPINKLPDSAVKERGHILNGAERDYLVPESIKAHEVVRSGEGRTADQSGA